MWKKIYVIIITIFLLVFLRFGPHSTRELNKLMQILKEHVEKNSYLNIELQCLSDIANYEHEENKMDEEELKLLMKSVDSYIDNEEIKILIR